MALDLSTVEVWQDGDWFHRTYADGTYQVYHKDIGAISDRLMIERLSHPTKPPRDWCVVRRIGGETHPDVVSGPFDSLDAAKAALILAHRALT